MSNPLDYRAPESGRMADCYEVAATAAFLAPRNPEPARWLAPARHAAAIHAISGKLHRLAESACNTGRDYSKRECKLMADATAIAAHYGCRAYHQGDPRGCSLYLIPDELVPVFGIETGSPEEAALEHRKLVARWIEENYPRGHAIARIGR